MTAPDGRFALFDLDGGGAILLSEHRRTLCFDGQNGDVASLFAAFEAASVRGE